MILVYKFEVKWYRGKTARYQDCPSVPVILVCDADIVDQRTRAMALSTSIVGVCANTHVTGIWFGDLVCSRYRYR